MTREEADELQAVLDKYVELRDQEPVGEPRFKSESRAAPHNETPEEKAIRVKRRIMSGIINNGYILMRGYLAAKIEALIPKVTLTSGGMDLTSLLGPLAGVLGVECALEGSAIPVVDGHEDVDRMDMDDEEFEKRFCVRVPADIMKEALAMRSSKSFVKMAMENKDLL